MTRKRENETGKVMKNMHSLRVTITRKYFFTPKKSLNYVAMKNCSVDYRKVFLVNFGDWLVLYEVFFMLSFVIVKNRKVAIKFPCFIIIRLIIII